MLLGEITTRANINFDDLVRKTVLVSDIPTAQLVLMATVAVCW